MISTDYNHIEATDKYLTNPFFSVHNSYFALKFNSENIVFSVDSVSNVRCFKKRNFTLNGILLFITLSTYTLIADYVSHSIYDTILAFTVFSILSFISLSVKNYTHILTIFQGEANCREFKLSKKQIPYADFFVVTFNNFYRKNKYQNDLDFLTVRSLFLS